MRLLLAIFLLACFISQTWATEWSPPKNPNARQILDEADTDIFEGRYELALAKIRWLYRTCQTDESIGEHLFSLLLFSFGELAREYEPAHKALLEARDEIRRAVLNDKKKQQSFWRFVWINDELSMISGELGMKRKAVVDLFVELDGKNRDEASGVFEIARPYLLESMEFSLCAAHIDADEEFSRMAKAYQTTTVETQRGRLGAGRFNRAEDELESGAAFLIALFARSGESETASSISNKAKNILDYKVSHKIFDAAFAGRFPKKSKMALNPIHASE